MLGQPGEHSATIDADALVTVHYDVDQPINLAALRNVLDQKMSTVWSEATVHAEEPFDRIWLHLSATDDGTIRIQADPKAIASRLCTPAIATRSPALADGDSLAYLTIRKVKQEPARWRLGAIGHGPRGHQLATRIAAQTNTWDHDRTADPHLVAYPTGVPLPATTAGKLITKPHIRLLLRYPNPPR